MGRPREHDDETALALLDAAEQLVQAGGPGAVSVRAVADAAGTTTRAVYSVYGSKEGLLVALASRTFDFLAERMAAHPSTDDPAGDLVEAGLHVFRHVVLEHPSLYRLAFQRVVPDLPRRHSPLAYELLCQRVARLDEAGLLAAGRDPATAAMDFHALCEGLANVELRSPSMLDPDPEAAWRRALGALVDGLALPSRTAPTARR